MNSARKNYSTGALCATTVAVFVMLASTLSWLDMLPESTQVAAQAIQASQTEEDSGQEASIPEDPNPTRVIIDKIDVDAKVSNPQSTNVQVLDEALTRGAVHYPDSADLGEKGNVLLFGHSSSLPVVHNRNYKIFNRVNELSKGDLIRVQSSTHEYVYQVTGVRMDRAEDIFVTFDTAHRRLTISTCNSFGAKDERWVVDADLVAMHQLPQAGERN